MGSVADVVVFRDCWIARLARICILSIAAGLG